MISLDAIAQSPESVGALRPEERARVQLQVAAILTALAAATDERPALRVADRVLTVRDVAAELGVSTKWVYDHASELGAHRIGGAVRIPRSGLERWRAQRQVG